MNIENGTILRRRHGGKGLRWMVIRQSTLVNGNPALVIMRCRRDGILFGDRHLATFREDGELLRYEVV